MQKKWLVALGIFIILSGIVLGQTLLVKSEAKDPILFLSLGDFLMKQGYNEQALAAYNKALEIAPENKAVLNNLGYYYKDKNPLLAEDYFKKALTVDPKYETARNNLALLYNTIGSYDLAAAQLRVLVQQNPDSLQYNYDLAINLAKNFYHNSRSYEELNEAITYFKIVYDKDPNFQHSLDNIKVLEEIRRTIQNN
jgi:tetratricopeptide (TPR) repeat protein